MREEGVIHAVSDGDVLVRLKRHAACLGCRACAMSSGGDMVMKAIAQDKVKVGDNVVIEIDSASIIKAITFIYLLPAVAFLVGVFAGLGIASLIGIYRHKEIFSIFIGLVLLSGFLILARWYGIKKRGAYQAKIVKVAKD